jgi:hypothetical protein
LEVQDKKLHPVKASCCVITEWKTPHDNIGREKEEEEGWVAGGTELILLSGIHSFNNDIDLFMSTDSHYLITS